MAEQQQPAVQLLYPNLKLHKKKVKKVYPNLKPFRLLQNAKSSSGSAGCSPAGNTLFTSIFSQYMV